MTAQRNAEHDLADELRNFEEHARVLKPSPGNVPSLTGIDIYGISMPLMGEIGGDHTIYVDFNRRYDLDRRIAEAERQGREEVAIALARNRDRAGVLLADVSGHRVTDAVIAAMLHQAFLIGVYYELDLFGEVSPKLFEHINQRFYRTTAVNKYLTMIYGEISRSGTFRFISAGHPPPRIFSHESQRFVDIPAECLVASPPVGTFVSNTELDELVGPGQPGFEAGYRVNELELRRSGDLILLYTDGLSEHADGHFFNELLEPLLAGCEDCDARTLALRIKRAALKAAEPEDDISYVVIQRLAVED